MSVSQVTALLRGDNGRISSYTYKQARNSIETVLLLRLWLFCPPILLPEMFRFSSANILIYTNYFWYRESG